MNTAIKISNLTIKYDNEAVLSDFSYSFEKGKCTAVTGPSGCGKTSLINAIMGLIPYEGHIMADDIRIAAVFQEDRLCEGMSVMRNIKLTSDKKYTSHDIEKTLCEIKLGGFASEKVCSLSGGMKRRVAIIRALMSPHNTLILDEPFKGLDISTKHTVMSYIQKNSSDTIILITHDLSEARFFNASVLDLGACALQR